MEDGGGCRLIWASSVLGPADTVPTEGGNPSWRLSVGRCGGGGGGRGRVGQRGGSQGLLPL